VGEASSFGGLVSPIRPAVPVSMGGWTTHASLRGALATRQSQRTSTHHVILNQVRDDGVGGQDDGGGCSHRGALRGDRMTMGDVKEIASPKGSQ
jgi:hypothetical protein